MLYTVKLLSFNNDEILMIDLCMTLCGLDMNSAAHCVDHMPSVLIKNADESKVEELKREFEAAGAVLQIISADEEAAMDPEDSVPVSNNTTIEETPVVNNPQTEYIDYSAYTETEEEAASVYDDFAMDSGEYDNYYQEDNSQQQEYVEDNQYQEQYSDEQQYTEEQYTEEYTEYTGDEQTEEYQEQSTEYVQQPETQSVVTMNEPEEEPPKEETKEENVMPSYCPMCGSAFISVKKSSGFFGGGRVKYICDACKHKF